MMAATALVFMVTFSTAASLRTTARRHGKDEAEEEAEEEEASGAAEVHVRVRGNVYEQTFSGKLYE